MLLQSFTASNGMLFQLDPTVLKDHDIRFYAHDVSPENYLAVNIDANCIDGLARYGETTVSIGPFNGLVEAADTLIRYSIEKGLLPSPKPS